MTTHVNPNTTETHNAVHHTTALAPRRSSVVFHQGYLENFFQKREKLLPTDGSHAVVFSGGANRIAFELGALLACIQREPAYSPTIISACSAGTILGGFLAQASIEGSHNFGLYTYRLEEILKTISTEMIYKPRWPVFGWIRAIFERGWYNSKPLQQLLAKHIDVSKIQASQRAFYAACYHLNRKHYLEIDQNNEHLLEFIQASPSYPIFFSSIEIPKKEHPQWKKDHRQYYRDGGIINIIPCQKLFENHVPSKIDLFLPSYPVPVRQPCTGDNIRNLFDDVASTLKGTYGEIYFNDLIPFIQYACAYDCEIRVMCPEPGDEAKLGQYNSLDFTQAALEPLKQYGFQVQPKELLALCLEMFRKETLPACVQTKDKIGR